MALQNYQNFIEMTSNMIYIVAFGGGLKCPRKIHLNTQCPPPPQFKKLSTSLLIRNPRFGINGIQVLNRISMYYREFLAPSDHANCTSISQLANMYMSHDNNICNKIFELSYHHDLNQLIFFLDLKDKMAP
jgi:hypothetical protein